MSDEFKVGDVVVCVNAETCPVILEPTRLKKNAIYRIIRAETKTCKKTGFTTFAVKVLEDDCWHVTARFKHLPKADDTFINQMRSLKPAKEMIK